MKFCSACHSNTEKNTSSGQLVFVCNRCGRTEPASDWDVRIFHADSESEVTKGMYHTLITNVPFVREAKRVKKDCKNCFRDTMVAVRVGDAENIIYRCECGGTEEVVSTISTM